MEMKPRQFYVAYVAVPLAVALIGIVPVYLTNSKSEPAQAPALSSETSQATPAQSSGGPAPQSVTTESADKSPDAEPRETRAVAPLDEPAQDVPPSTPPATTRGEIVSFGGRAVICDGLSATLTLQPALKKTVVALDTGDEYVLRLNEPQPIGTDCQMTLFALRQMANGVRATLTWRY